MTAKGYGELIVKRKWLTLLAGLLFTVFWMGGLSGLSMNPDNRIFFSKDNKVNLTSLLGYFASTKFVNTSPTKAELFSVGCEIAESSK